MRSSRPRVWVIGAVCALGAAVVAVHLLLLTVENGEVWRHRSFRNRWAFRDVPTQRGAIHDVDGEVIAEDEPAFALLLYYREFRRDHPVGCAVHGANLMMQAAGVGGDLFGFDHRERGPDQALESLLAMPHRWLRGEDVSREVARDLRFYAVSLVSRLLSESWSSVHEVVRRKDEAPVRTLAEALGPDRVERVRSEYAARHTELRELAEMIELDRYGRDLFSILESRRLERFARPETEDVLRRIQDAIPFELAARLTLLRERHPGLSPQPSVERRIGAIPGRQDLASLENLIGLVTPYWGDDESGDPDRLEREVGAMLRDDVLNGLVPDDAALPENFVESLARDARRKVTAHFQIHGRVGRSGVEVALDDVLSGRPGLRLVEKTRKARETGLWSSLSTTPGHDVKLTLDLDLQRLLEQSLDRFSAGTETGFAVIDPRTGDILALGGRPLGTEEEPVWTCPATYWRGVGYVGSVAKPLVLLEQLDARRHGRPHRPISSFEPCGGSYRIAGMTLSCHVHGARGQNGPDAIAHSCNIFFYQAAQGLGTEGVERAYRRFGWMGDASDAPRYQRGVLGIPQIGKPRSVARGNAVERRAIGYGVEASTLHVARAYAGLATGRLPALGIVVGDRSHDSVPLDVAVESLDEVRDGLAGCVRSGTARRVEGLVELGVLAKTGTAEISVTTRANNAWFAGYTTRDHPTLAFAAVAYDVPDQEHGGDVAGALVADFLRAVYADLELRRRYLPALSGR